MSMNIQGKTDSGSVREHNEDSIEWWFFSASNILCCALADGMGGYDGGAMASELAIEAIRENMSDISASEQPIMNVIEQHLTNAGAYANSLIQLRRLSEPQFSKMGTTLVVAAVHGHEMCVMHAGDSRCYLFRDNILQALTRDDSVVQQMIDDGSISEEEGERTPYRNVLVKAVGVEPSLQYTLSRHLLQEGDQVLLCSDGLFNTLSSADIAHILASSATTTEKVDELIALSLQRHASDNVSTILLAVTE